MKLSKIITKYNGTCNKCKRDIKQGWTVFFDSDDKKIYCKPCGEPMSKGQPSLEETVANENVANEKPATPAMLLLEEISAQVSANAELLGALSIQVSGIVASQPKTTKVK